MLRYTEWHLSFAKERYYHSYSSVFNKKKKRKKRYLKLPGFIVNSVDNLYRRAVPGYFFFLHSLVNCYSRNQNSKLYLARSQSMGKWFIHFESRSIETLTALSDLLCKFKIDF